MKNSVNAELGVVYRPETVMEDASDRTPADDLTSRLRLLWRERRFLFRASISGLLAFTLIAFLIPKKYESTTRLMPPDDQSVGPLAMAAALSGRMAGGVGGMASELLGLKSSGDLFIGILESRSIQDDLINRFDLRKSYGAANWLTARKILANNTVISADRHSGIITITVTDKSPQRAAAMAQEYVSQLNSVVSRLTTSSARREREFLESRLAQVRRDLEDAEKDFSQFANKNGALDIKEQGKAMVGAAASLQGELIAAESELQGLKQIYADNSIRIRSLNARVAELRSQLDKLGGKQDIGSDATADDSGSLYPSIRKLPLLGVAYADLYRRTKVQEAVFETLTQEYELAKVAEAKETPSVKILDPADVPEHKSFPPRLLIMSLGCFFSFGFAAMWLLVKEYWEEVHPQAPQKILAGEVFQTVRGCMPWAPPNGSSFQAASHKVWARLVRKNSAYGPE